mmetsp:Transcript_42674/g.104457  ORF Transcript_42674/g.104457 Transcript_42674/m.104457 type:complete len:125 (+) Transcript_42674:102-476(+)
MARTGNSVAVSLFAALVLSVPQARSFLGGVASSASLHPAGRPLRGRSFAGRTAMSDRFHEPVVRDDGDEGPHERVGYATKVPARYVQAAGGLGEMKVKQLTLVLCYDGAARLAGDVAGAGSCLE